MKFGEKVSFTEVYKRMRSHRQDGTSPNFIKTREWIPFLHETPKEGIVIGKRTLKNGDIYYEYDDGWQFEPKSHIQAYLIATDMRSKPVLVPINNVTKISEQ